jgi:hypothetical protein
MWRQPKVTLLRVVKFALINCLFTLSANAQLIVNKTAFLNDDEVSVSEFISANKFEFALVTWKTSTWFSEFKIFSGLFKQNNKWYLAEISSPAIAGPSGVSTLHVKQVELSERRLQPLLNELQPDSAFYYNQQAFNGLPDTCSYVKNGKRMGLYGISDAGTYHLFSLSNSKLKYLHYYAPSAYISKCYPFVPLYKILLNFINTCDRLWNATNRI